MGDCEYPWYKEIQNSRNIEQGDFIPECPIIVPPRDIAQDSTPEVDIKLIDSIVLSQSCDLVNDKLEIVLVCPYYPVSEFIKNQKYPGKPEKEKKNLIQGKYAGFHILEKYPGYLDVLQVVDFKNVYGIKIEALRDIAESIEKRIRLLPPYREHLSQAFARYFMRVGLPQDIILEDD